MYYVLEIGIKLFFFKGMLDMLFYSIIEIVLFCCWLKKLRSIEYVDCFYGLNNIVCK